MAELLGEDGRPAQHVRAAGAVHPANRDGTVGRLTGIWRYPVKSMAGASIDTAELSWQGIAGDRRWAFVRPGKAASGFPWLTARQVPSMTLYQPFLTEPGRPEASAVRVRTPDGDELDVLDQALAARLGADVQVMRQNRGTFDTVPISVLSTATVAALGERLGTDVDVRRFRPNLVIDAGEIPFVEERWVGRVLTIGAARLRLDDRIGRCVMVNVDPATARRDPAVLRLVATERETCVAVAGSTVQPGELAVGDAVVLED